MPDRWRGFYGINVGVGLTVTGVPIPKQYPRANYILASGPTNCVIKCVGDTVVDYFTEDWIYLGRLTFVSQYGLGVSIASSSAERVPWG